MKHFTGVKAVASILAFSLTLIQVSITSFPADARGGGRGFGGAGFGGRGDFGERGLDGGDRGMWSGDGGFRDGGSRDGGAGRDAGFDDRTRASEDDLRAGANQDYHWSNLPTDGGMARAAGFDAPRVTSNVSAASLAARGAAVRNNFHRDDLFNRDFWNRYDRAWWYPGWGEYWPWGYTGWGDLCSFWGYPESDEPVEYDYGNNITYQDNQVYYGNQPYMSESDYYTQAQNLALSAPPSVPPATSSTKSGTKTNTKPGTKAGASSKTTEKESDWKPLGVFALTQGDQTDSNSIFQLAVNKKGIIRGNYFNPLTQEEQPVQGKIDQKSKRVAWTVGSNKTVVYDTGLANLLAKQSSLLIHLSGSKTQQWNIIRLQHGAST
jgi:hypothetical protein